MTPATHSPVDKSGILSSQEMELEPHSFPSQAISILTIHLMSQTPLLYREDLHHRLPKHQAL
jgi:hypothetical protein